MRALVLLTAASLRRMAREGSVVRALAWPGLLCVGTLSAVAAVARPGPPAETVVEHRAQAEVLEAAGLVARVVPDAEVALKQGAERAWTQEGLVLAPRGWARLSGRRAQEDLAVEAAVREAQSSSWRLAPAPSPSARPAAAAEQAQLLARLLAMVCALYAVVLTVASAVRDRESGVLEAIHTAPLPALAPPLARALAVVLGCGSALVLSVAALGGLLELPGLGARLPGLLAGVVGGAALGTGALGGTAGAPVGPWSGAPAGMTPPLRTGLVAASAAGALGALWSPAAALPLATLGAADPSAGQGWAALVLSVGALLWSCRRVGAAGW